MTEQLIGPNDETQDIPYDPTNRKTQEIPVQRKIPTSDSGRLRAIAGVYGYAVESRIPPIRKLAEIKDISGPDIGYHNETILFRSSCSLSLEAALTAYRALENYKRSKAGESK